MSDESTASEAAALMREILCDIASICVEPSDAARLRGLAERNDETLAEGLAYCISMMTPEQIEQIRAAMEPKGNA